MSYIISAKSVQVLVACSALPNISSKVFNQPELTASRAEFIASSKVRASCAALNPFSENASICPFNSFMA